MMTPPMRFFRRKSAKKKFTEKDLAQMRFTEKLKAADRNPYSWNMDLFEYPDGVRCGNRLRCRFSRRSCFWKVEF